MTQPSSLRVLVLVQAYPSAENPYRQAFVHARVLAYLQQGWQVDLVSFACRESYHYDGVDVHPEVWLSRAVPTYDVWVSHAPNLRNHLRLILSRPHQWRRLVWVHHGHEVLIKQKYYPRPYAWMPQPSALFRLCDWSYDVFKLAVLAWFLRQCLRRRCIQLIFVSTWLKQAFFQGVPIAENHAEQWTSVIPNPVNPLFLAHEWQSPAEPRADFITIRPLDESRCALDFICRLAHTYPDLRFAVYGTGRFFEFQPPPPNLSWQAGFFQPSELPALLCGFRAALMPTRHDTQGVMTCEMAALGMPVLTSDLPVCLEMLQGYPRVDFLNENHPLDLREFLRRPLAPVGPRERFSVQQTLCKEMHVIASGQAC